MNSLRVVIVRFSWAFLSVGGLALGLADCSKGASHSGHAAKGALQMFFGECRLSIHSSPDHAEIIVDGVEVGHDQVDLEVPCGEKRILVRKKGFVPYNDYIPVTKDKAVKLNVELEKFAPAQNEALSADLIEKLRPTKLASNAGQAGTTGDAGSAGAAAPVQEVEDSVENWR